MSEQEGKYKGSIAYHLVYAELIRAAQYRGIVTYQDIAVLMGLPLSGNHMGAEVGLMLGEIVMNEHHYGRPMLSAIVVSTAGQPSGGFYKLAGELGLLPQDTPEARQKLLESQRRQVYDTWKRTVKA